MIIVLIWFINVEFVVFEFKLRGRLGGREVFDLENYWWDLVNSGEYLIIINFNILIVLQVL